MSRNALLVPLTAMQAAHLRELSEKVRAAESAYQAAQQTYAAAVTAIAHAVDHADDVHLTADLGPNPSITIATKGGDTSA